MNKYLLLLFALSPVLLLAQERKSLRGKAVADMVTADNLTVKNITANIVAITDFEGNFTINAIADDVLEFSSITFKTLTYTLKTKDFEEELLVVRVEPSAIVLDEVKLTGLTGSLAIDSKNVKVMPLNGLFDAAAINMNVVNENVLGNMNFVAIFGLLYNAIFPSSSSSRKAVQTYAPVEQKPFSKILQESFPQSFFTETVGIAKERLGLFLHSCNGDAKRYLLDPKNEEQLIAYLKEKYIFYQRQTEINEN